MPIRPVLQFRNWKHELWGCDRIENRLFIIHPRDNPAAEEAHAAIQFNLGAGAYFVWATYQYDPAINNLKFHIEFDNNMEPYDNDFIVCFGWYGDGTHMDKWSATWDAFQAVWFINPWRK